MGSRGSGALCMSSTLTRRRRALVACCFIQITAIVMSVALALGVQEVATGVRVREATIEKAREDHPVSRIATLEARRKDSEERELMLTMDAGQAAHERQGCRGEPGPPERWHDVGAREVEWCLLRENSMEGGAANVIGVGNVDSLQKERSWNLSCVMRVPEVTNRVE